MSSLDFNVSVLGHVHIQDINTKEVYLDKYNKIHPENAARIIARALAHESNSYIYRLALGDGGAQFVAGQVVINPPLDGSDGSGWETRLYNETYSEIVDETSPLVGTDPGSYDSNGLRVGGGAVPADDPATDNVVSQEAGTKSNVIITCYLNENEPVSQVSDMTTPTSGSENDYVFSELGLYSPGSQAVSSPGYSTVYLNNKTSSDTSLLVASTQYGLALTVNGTSYTCTIQTPSSGTGSSGAITYGDICEGINGGSWITSGDAIYNNVYVYITDDTNGTYASITNKQSSGQLIFQSKSTGTSSSVSLSTSATFFTTLVNNIVGYINYATETGANAGVANDPTNSSNERERLLTHITFSPITKSKGSSLVLTYSLTISVSSTTSSIVNEVNQTN